MRHLYLPLADNATIYDNRDGTMRIVARKAPGIPMQVLDREVWETIEENTFDPRSDSHGIVSTPVGPLVVGGLVTNTAVSARVVVVPKK